MQNTNQNGKNNIDRTIYQELNSLQELKNEEIEELYKQDLVSGLSLNLELKFLLSSAKDLEKEFSVLAFLDYHRKEELCEEISTIVNKINRIGNNRVSPDSLSEALTLIRNCTPRLRPKIIEFIQYLEEQIEDIKKQNDDFEVHNLVNGKRRKNRIYPSIETRDKVFLGSIKLLKIHASIYYKKLRGRVDYDDISNSK